MQRYTYFTIPFDKAPQHPACTMWFATWSTTRPVLASGAHPPFVVAATTGELPEGARLLGEGPAEPTPPPAPPSPTVSLDDYARSVARWLAGRPAAGRRYRYFAMPFDQVPEAPDYLVWFATWANVPPPVASEAHPPHVVGVTAGELPPHAVQIGASLKDPPPPPALPVPGTFASCDYDDWVTTWLADERGL